MSESFDGVMDFARKISDCEFGEHPNDLVREWCEIHDCGTCTVCLNRLLDRLQRAHDHDMEQRMREQYARGYTDGQRSMDAEHRAVALRLQQLPLDEDSHGNLNQIARALYHSDWGWTQGACRGLRDELIRLMGGVHDEPVPVRGHSRTCPESGDGVSMSASSVSITDELREWNRTTPYLGKGGFELHEIAGHIDSEFARLLKQKDDAWQATCEHVSDECDAECQMYRDMLNDAAREFRDLVAEHECCREERDELQAKLDAVREALDE